MCKLSSLSGSGFNLPYWRRKLSLRRGGQDQHLHHHHCCCEGRSLSFSLLESIVSLPSWPFLCHCHFICHFRVPHCCLGLPPFSSIRWLLPQHIWKAGSTLGVTYHSTVACLDCAHRQSICIMFRSPVSFIVITLISHKDYHEHERHDH